MNQLTRGLSIKKEKIQTSERDIVLVTSSDLRESANKSCWAVQDDFEKKFEEIIRTHFNYNVIRAHAYNTEQGYGFIASQHEGCDIFKNIDTNSPLVVVLTAWQYSHHLAPSLVTHKDPILLLANFNGTWPGLVGALCMAGTLTSLERKYKYKYKCPHCGSANCMAILASSSAQLSYTQGPYFITG